MASEKSISASTAFSQPQLYQQWSESWTRIIKKATALVASFSALVTTLEVQMKISESSSMVRMVDHLLRVSPKKSLNNLKS